MFNRQKTQPIAVRKSRRLEEKRVLTSGTAGKVLPIAYIPLLREDKLYSSRMRISLAMMETAETLMNGVNAQINAYFVPKLAFDRFNGMDALDRSYMGEEETTGGGTVIPYIETTAFGALGANEIFATLGLHGKTTDLVNNDIVEAYNCIWNFRAKNRSPNITERLMTDTTLATAFWHHTAMKHIVPDFDQARVDGEVALTVVNGRMPVKGIGIKNGDAFTDVNLQAKETDGTAATTYAKSFKTANSSSSMLFKEDPDNLGYPEIYAQFQQEGLIISLANIQMARDTATFAELRKTYTGHDDEYIIDMLMDGLTVSKSALNQPILLDTKNVVFGYQERHATDAANLDESMTTGQAVVDLALRLPQIPTGGVIMITAEITPEQMFERQKDYYLHAQDVDAFPSYLKDFLDPEKVAIVKNSHVDTEHTTPDATFGYAPLNHEWAMRQGPNIGGKFLRPLVDTAFDEDRQRLWSPETTDPQLTEDFYLCTDMHTKPFEDTVGDAFEILGRGQFAIEGNTVFGSELGEATNDYDTVMAKIDQTRIDKTA